MDQQILISSRDSLLVAIPFLLIFFITLFRLDQLIAPPRGMIKQHRHPCGVDESGEPILRDPDGRLSGMPRRSKPRN